MVFHESLSDSKSSQVSRTLLSILADLNNSVVWMVSIRPLMSKFSSSCTNTVVTVRKAVIISQNANLIQRNIIHVKKIIYRSI